MSNSFQESVAYLLSLGNEVLAMKLGLENVRKLLNALGCPQDKYLKVQVAGTNGKGSVCAFLNSICISAGVRVGMFTSPHLISITERVQIDGDDITEDAFARFATRVRETAERLVASGDLENVPTFFEQVTAIALLAFADAKVELAILETGLGGRLDATTAANAEIAAITRIDLDHQQYLGETIEEIAAEKAAIIRDENQRVVIGEQRPEAMKVLLNRCADMNVEPLIADSAFRVPHSNLETPSLPAGFPPVPLGLRGTHQIANARIAVLLAHLLTDRFQISDEQIVHGLTSARHPGRLEHIDRFILDGAHNSGGARALRDYLDGFVQQPITMVFGSMDDKDVAEILSVLVPRVSLLVLTQADSPRSRSPIQLKADLPDDFDRSSVVLTENVADALTQAIERTPPDTTILITGSLYLVGEASRILKSQI